MEPDEEQEAAVPAAVIVLKTIDEDGSIRTDIVMQGDVQATEVQTLLELAVRGWRQRIGLVG